MRGWLSHAPIGVGLAIIVMLVLAGLQNHYRDTRPHQGTPGDQQHGTADRVPNARNAPVTTPHPPPPEPEPDRQEWRSEQDLQAQRDMAEWAFFAMIAAGAGVFVTGVGIVFIKLTLDANRAAVAAAVEATETTRKIGQRQVRAYLQLTGVDFENVEYVEDGVAPTINLHFKNFGQSPGRKVVNHMTVTFVFAGKPKFKEPIAIDAAGMDIGPGQDTTTTTFVSLDGLREALENRVAKMFVGGVITYVDVFDEPHTTRYRLQLHVNPEGLRDTDAFIICKEGNESD